MRFKCIYISLLISWLFSCSPTKYLPEGEVLYTGVKSISIEKQILPDEPKKIEWSNKRK